VSARFGVERRQEARLHRFGLALGVVLAVAFHAALFWGPRVRYRPVLEEARVRRVLVAHPYQAAPPPPPPERVQTEASPRPPAAAVPPGEVRAATAAPRAAAASPPEGGGEEVRLGLAEPTTADRGRTAAAMPRPDAAPGKAQPAGPDEWTAVLAELRSRGASLAEQGHHRKDLARESAGGRSGEAREAGEEGNGYLDPRIRATVASYPPTSVEMAHPPIPYPDLRFHRKQLQAGICRVYYRVWTDGRGRVVRFQLKYPTTREEEERYAPFVQAVREAVDQWPFDRTEAEVHVDVLFEIE